MISMENEMSVGERIRYFRLFRGMSQEALALEANINTAFVGHLERGLKSPTITTLTKITDALGISLGELFADSLSSCGKRDGRQAVIAHLEYLIWTMSEEESEQFLNVIQEIIRFKNQP